MRRRPAPVPCSRRRRREQRRCTAASSPWADGALGSRVGSNWAVVQPTTCWLSCTFCVFLWNMGGWGSGTHASKIIDDQSWINLILTKPKNAYIWNRGSAKVVYNMGNVPMWEKSPDLWSRCELGGTLMDGVLTFMAYAYPYPWVVFICGLASVGWRSWCEPNL